MTIQAHIHPDTRGKYTLTVRETGNNEILLSSTRQGYENAGDAEKLARRLFGGPHPIAFGGGGAARGIPQPFPQAPGVTAVGAGGGAGGGGITAGTSGDIGFAAGGGGTPEPVELRVTYLDGTDRIELIR